MLISQSEMLTYKSENLICRSEMLMCKPQILILRNWRETTDVVAHRISLKGDSVAEVIINGYSTQNQIDFFRIFIHICSYNVKITFFSSRSKETEPSI
jgi:hypothetical protein